MFNKLSDADGYQLISPVGRVSQEASWTDESIADSVSHLR
jgi:hypothetical protein